MKKAPRMTNLELATYLRSWVDVYYDDELDPPCWGPRKVKKSDTEYGSLEVIDFDCAENKKEAIKHAKEWSKKSGLPLMIDGELCKKVK